MKSRPTGGDNYPGLIIKDSMLPMNELYMNIWIEGDRQDQELFAEMFAKARCTKALSVDKADLVVFTGGVDVNPALYGEKAHRTVSFSVKRDDDDIALYKYCMDEGVPMLGICRGAQFLHVMQGGKLWQDVNHHYGDHAMLDVRGNILIHQISSVHHQMVQANRCGGMEVLGTTMLADKRWRNDTICISGKEEDIEAFFYRDTCVLGIQGHPEYRGYNQFQQWTFRMIQELVVSNPDILAINQQYRIRPEIREARAKEMTKQLEGAN